MKLNQVSETKHPLLKRRDVVYRTANDAATPSRHEIVKAIEQKEKGTVIVRHVYPHAGEHVIEIHVSVYEDAAIAGKLERANLLSKQRAAASAAAEE